MVWHWRLLVDSTDCVDWRGLWTVESLLYEHVLYTVKGCSRLENSNLCPTVGCTTHELQSVVRCDSLKLMLFKFPYARETLHRPRHYTGSAPFHPGAGRTGQLNGQASSLAGL